MSTNLFNNAKFNFAWEIPYKINLFNKEHDILISADAYFETEKVTSEQENSGKDFIDNHSDILSEIEKSLVAEAGTKDLAEKRFIPKTVKIKQNGDYGMVFDDKEDFENGLVVAIKPKFVLMSTDEFF